MTWKQGHKKTHLDANIQVGYDREKVDYPVVGSVSAIKPGGIPEVHGFCCLGGLPDEAVKERESTAMPGWYES